MNRTIAAHTQPLNPTGPVPEPLNPTGRRACQTQSAVLPFTRVVAAAFAIVRLRGFPEDARTAVGARVRPAGLDSRPVRLRRSGQGDEFRPGLGVFAG